MQFGGLSHNRAVGMVLLPAPGQAAVQKDDQGRRVPPARGQHSG